MNASLTAGQIVRENVVVEVVREANKLLWGMRDVKSDEKHCGRCDDKCVGPD